MWEAQQDAVFICLEERGILQFELHGLLLSALCVIALMFNYILTDVQKVITCDKSRIPNRLRLD